MQKRLILDCDGVCADWMGKVEDTVGDCWDKSQHNVFATMPEGQRAALREAMRDPVWWASIRPYKDAMVGVDRAKSAGWDILWATSPWESCFGWDSVRRAWLWRHFQATPSHIMCGVPKHWLSANVMVEDKPKNLADWKESNPDGVAVLIAQPYNATEERFMRVSWDQIDLIGGIVGECVLTR